MPHMFEGARHTPGRRSCGSSRSPRPTALLLALLVAAAYAPCPASAQKWKAALRGFLPAGDVPAQRAALLQLLGAVGADSELVTKNPAAVVGNPGIAPWGANTSYCTWWGVNCCGTTLTSSLELCKHGTNSVSALHVAAVGLVGQLPDVFDDLPDVSLIDMAFNRGARRAHAHAARHAAAARGGLTGCVCPRQLSSAHRSPAARRGRGDGPAVWGSPGAAAALRLPSLPRRGLSARFPLRPAPPYRPRPRAPRAAAAPQACPARCLRAWGGCATSGSSTSPAPASPAAASSRQTFSRPASSRRRAWSRRAPSQAG